MEATHCTHSIPIPRARPGVLVRLFDRLLDWLERARQRDALGRLDERMLADIGLNQAAAAEEARKPFWRG